jgi:hypothetical protein
MASGYPFGERAGPDAVDIVFPVSGDSERDTERSPLPGTGRQIFIPEYEERAEAADIRLCLLNSVV